MKNFKPLSAILFLLLISSCKSGVLPDKIGGYKVPQPTAKIVNFDIDSISLLDITLLFDIEIYNPYPVKLTLSKIESTFFVENKQFFKTSSDKFSIKAKDKETTRIFVNLKYLDIINIVKDYTNKDSLECVVDMLIVIPLPKSVSAIAEDLKFNFKLSKEIPAIKPEINIANFSVIKPSQKEIEAAIKNSANKNLNVNTITNMFGAILDGKNPAKVIDPSDLDLKLKVNFDVVLKNKTKAEMLFQDLNYDFKVNDSKLVDGYTKDIKNNQGESVIGINNDFSSKALGASILKAFNESKGNYSLAGYSMVKFPDKIKKTPIRINFNEKGTLSIK
ncbi:MAG: LEA type 2 family protein [Spirochaetes bacterium]|nr:LEA type 2 family protein [Spirochaetota bacterium]